MDTSEVELSLGCAQPVKATAGFPMVISEEDCRSGAIGRPETSLLCQQNLILPMIPVSRPGRKYHSHWHMQPSRPVKYLVRWGFSSFYRSLQITSYIHEYCLS